MESKYSNDKQLQFRLEVGQQCAFFRKYVLRFTLRYLSKSSGIPVPTLSSFELGRSSNLRFLYVYLASCETEAQKNILIKTIDQLLERVGNND